MLTLKSFKPKSVLLDWDGTMRKGFTLMSWMHFLSEKNFVNHRFFEAICSEFQAYKASRIGYNQLAERTAKLYARALKGRSFAEYSSLVKEFVPQDRLQLYPFTVPLVQLFQKHGLVSIVISGAPLEIVEQHAEELGIQKVIGLKLEVKNNGKFSGRIKENPALKEVKEKWVKTLMCYFDIVLAIGNSIADIPMLAAAKSGLMLSDKEQNINIADRESFKPSPSLDKKIVYVDTTNLMLFVSKILENKE